MQEKTKKLVTLIMLALALVGAALAIVFALNEAEGMYWAAYWLTVALFGAAFALIAVFFIAGICKDKKKLVKFLIGLVAVIAVVVVLYFIAPGIGNVRPETIAKYDVTEGVAKFVEAAIYLVYALVIGAALSIVYVECSKAFKKK
ncbi:MAG: hypothetical protein MJZ51_00100 [Bacteroidales bacterium]|nr:hypothetical protein [Bacteroidales bacterium]